MSFSAVAILLQQEENSTVHIVIPFFRKTDSRKQYLSAGIDPEPVILRGALIGLTKDFTEIADSIESAHLCNLLNREIGVQQQLRRHVQAEFTNITGRSAPECLLEMPAQ